MSTPVTPSSAEPTPTTPPAAAPANSAAPATPADPPQDPASRMAALEKELGEARREAAASRTKLKGFEDAEAKARADQMTEVEKLQSQIAELQKGLTDRDDRIKAMDLRSAVQRVAAKLGFADPEDALALLPSGAVEFTEDGRPKNLEHLLGEVIRAKPYLRASYSQMPDAGQGNRGVAPGTLTRADLARMTEAQVMALPPAEVDAALARG